MKKLFLTVLLGMAAAVFPSFAQDEARIALSLMNYLYTETLTIQESKNNRLELERLFDSLLNDLRDRAIDESSQTQITGMFADIGKLRLLTFQREQLKYIYDSQKAQAINKAMPNPLYLLGTIRPGTNPAVLIASLAGMALDSATKYASAANESKMQYLTENWTLDAAERETIEKSRVAAWNYKINIGRKYNFEDTITERAIKEFVKYRLEPNSQTRRQFLESERAQYKDYAPYWLELSKTYYELADRDSKSGKTDDAAALYRLCLDSISQYEKAQAKIFRVDNTLAAVMPLGVAAAAAVYGTGPEYIRLASHFLQTLEANTLKSECSLRFFAAQNYIYLAALDNREENLRKAYQIIVDNLTYYSAREQRQMLEDYRMSGNTLPATLEKDFNDAQRQVKRDEDSIEEDLMSSDTKFKKTNKSGREKYERALELNPVYQRDKAKLEQIKLQVNGYLAQRAKALPPLHDSLYLNFKTLFALYNELNVPRQEKDRINQIIGDSFVFAAFRAQYLGERVSTVSVGEVVHNTRFLLWGKEDLTFSYFPVVALLPNAKIDIKVTDGGDTSRVVYEEKNIAFTQGDVLRETHGNCTVFLGSGGMANLSPLYSAALVLSPTGNIITDKSRTAYFDITIYNDDLFLSLRFTKPAGMSDNHGINPTADGL